jgi:acetoin utilization deacetylase AcuC-like enzyme
VTSVHFSGRFSEHTTPPGHPERPERAEIFGQVAAEAERRGIRVPSPQQPAVTDLIRVHTDFYLTQLSNLAGRAAMLDEDTFTSPESIEVAQLAVGAAIAAARDAVAASAPTLALVRPPGHHATPDRAMGFCLYNNIAIAAAALRADGLERVAVVDIDVHHGNGTQDVFYEDPNVLFISSHQYPYWPGTGAADERGAGAGVGFTLNLPLPAGSTDADYESTYRQQVIPALEAFAPEAMLISAGFDAHQLDPLGGMRVSTAGFKTLTDMLDQTAQRLCRHRIAWITEGGYHLDSLRDCLMQLLPSH